VGMDGSDRMDSENSRDKEEGWWEWMGKVRCLAEMDGTNRKECCNGWDRRDIRWMGQMGRMKHLRSRDWMG
jgi:hypothetical protein